MADAEFVTDIPRWGPLERFVLDEDKLGDWMWMEAYTVGGERRIEVYKHCDTREHLFLDGEGSPVSRAEIEGLRFVSEAPRFGETRSEVANVKATDHFVEAVREGDIDALQDVLAYDYFLYVGVADGTIERGSDRFIERLRRRTLDRFPVRRWGGDHHVAVVEMGYLEQGTMKLSVLVLEMRLGRVASATEYAFPMAGPAPDWWDHLGELWCMQLPDDPT